jgi:fermentation-respiration switch protein FrsA (DUF1100 family)
MVIAPTHSPLAQYYLETSKPYASLYETAWYKAAIANPKFQKWMEDQHPALKLADGRPILIFHGAKAPLHPLSQQDSEGRILCQGA